MNRPPRPSRRERAAPVDDSRERAIAEVVATLQGRPRRISAKWFYDAEGSALFERITRLPEYYLTRTELAILAEHLPAIARRVGPEAQVIEPGAGSGIKTERLLAALERPRRYTAIDVSGAALSSSMARLRQRFPALELHPVVEDFTGDGLERVRPQATVEDGGAPLLYFPGSTLGNFEPGPATRLLARFRALGGPRARLLLGADLAKEPSLLLPAYDDAAGVTAAFNRNALRHLNRALGADFALERFVHRVRFDAVESRIEMHLESTVDQVVRIGGERIAFAAGETIHTEDSYKHPPERLLAIAAAAGWAPLERWTDARGWFGVFLFEAADGG